jgi:regulator of nucleoside diphosphate kinase
LSPLEEKLEDTVTKMQQSELAQRPPIVLTSSDREQLLKLLQKLSSGEDQDALLFLRQELERADIAPDGVSGSSVVRMGCDVTFVENNDTWLQYGRLVYPTDVDNKRCISVLSTVGSALIGLGPGQSIGWVEDGRERVLAVLHVGTNGCR